MGTKCKYIRIKIETIEDVSKIPLPRAMSCKIVDDFLQTEDNIIKISELGFIQAQELTSNIRSYVKRYKHPIRVMKRQTNIYLQKLEECKVMCNYCQKTFNTFKDIQNRYQCPECNKKLSEDGDFIYIEEKTPDFSEDM
jgi:hypothetical protein